MVDKKTDNKEGAADNEASSETRRKAMKRVLVGSGVVATSKVVPDSWSQPVIDSVVLPTHAESTTPDAPAAAAAPAPAGGEA